MGGKLGCSYMSHCRKLKSDDIFGVPLETEVTRTKALGSRCSRKRRKNLAHFDPIGPFPRVIAELGNPSADSSQES